MPAAPSQKGYNNPSNSLPIYYKPVPDKNLLAQQVSNVNA